MNGFTPVKIRKRNVERTVFWPEQGWYSLESVPAAKHFRFEDNETKYVRGQLTIVFDLQGVATEGWSYWTCIYARTEPSDDFPNGRTIYNASGYGTFTAKHIHAMRAFFEGYGEQVDVTRKVYRRVQKTVRTIAHKSYTYTDWEGAEHVQPAWIQRVTRATQAYTVELETESEFLIDMQRVEQIGWGRGATPSELREELRRCTRTPAQVEADEQARQRAELERERHYAEIDAKWKAEEAKWKAEEAAWKAGLAKVEVVA